MIKFHPNQIIINVEFWQSYRLAIRSEFMNNILCSSRIYSMHLLILLLVFLDCLLQAHLYVKANKQSSVDVESVRRYEAQVWHRNSSLPLKLKISCSSLPLYTQCVAFIKKEELKAKMNPLAMNRTITLHPEITGTDRSALKVGFISFSKKLLLLPYPRRFIYVNRIRSRTHSDSTLYGFKGIGTALMATAFDIGHRMQYKWLGLISVPDAVGFYTKLMMKPRNRIINPTWYESNIDRLRPMLIQRAHLHMLTENKYEYK